MQPEACSIIVGVGNSANIGLAKLCCGAFTLAPILLPRNPYHRSHIHAIPLFPP